MIVRRRTESPVASGIALTRFVAPSPRSVARLPNGGLFARKYRILGKLGEGQMGEVFHALHVQLDHEVAIKILRPELAADVVALQRFSREARAAARIANDHVVRVLDIGGFDEGEPYIAMELLEGEDLARRTERGVLTVAEAVDVLLQACVAIQEVHRAGVVHRDLKPANLFLARREGRAPIVKLVDFGISKLAPRPGHAEPALTSASTWMGTPLYMAPEQLRSECDVDARADVWALGAILFELLTGQAPFEEKELFVLCSRILNEATPRLEDVRPDLPFPPALDAVLARCLTKDPNERCQSAAELARLLEPFVGWTAPRRTSDRTKTLEMPKRPMASRAELAPTLMSRRATWELSRADVAPPPPSVPPAVPSRRLLVAVFAAALPLVGMACVGASCALSHARAERVAAVVGAPLDVRSTPAAPPPSARAEIPRSAVEPPSVEAAPATASPPPSVHRPAASSAAPEDEFGGRL